MVKLGDFISDDNEMSKKTQRVLSIIFLLMACFMTIFEYTEVHKYWFDSTLNIKPGINQTFIAILLISPLYMRNILKWNKSIYTLITLPLFILLFASLIKLALGGGGFKEDMITYLIIASLLLSWLGMRSIAGMSWIILIVAVVYAQVQNGNTMGFYGFIYLTTGFMGLVLHSELNPGHLVQGLKEEFSTSNIMTSEVKKDIQETIQNMN